MEPIDHEQPHRPVTRTLITLVLLATTSLQVLASPLSFADIERRWSAGESDVSRETRFHLNK